MSPPHIWLYLWVSINGGPLHWEMMPKPMTLQRCVDIGEVLVGEPNWACDNEPNLILLPN
jgi:hypothetical protein